MKLEIKNIVYLCGARDFHAIDWYRSTLHNNKYNNLNIYILTDLIESEGYKKLITSQDKIHKLFILDKLLFTKETKYGNYWRNFLKMLVFPLQLYLLIKFNKKNPNSVFHAHSMYYLWLACAARLNYVGTPQGSDILVKPNKSKVYRYFSKLALQSAKYITVDSRSMSLGVISISGLKPYIIQNGIDLSSLTNAGTKKYFNRDQLVSIRGFSSLYCLEKILDARNRSMDYHNQPITFIYPFVDSKYKERVSWNFKNFDLDIGRLDKDKMYDLLYKSFLVISIPQSDSSPRSVYEAIFCGCAVAIRYNSYYDNLPECMKSRIILIDFKKPNWFDDAVISARLIIESNYVPSKEALDDFDQLKSSDKMIKLLLN
jgi:hypothetical protein